MIIEIEVNAKQHQQLQQLAEIHSLTLPAYLQATVVREIRILRHFLEAPASVQSATAE